MNDFNNLVAAYEDHCGVKAGFFDGITLEEMKASAAFPGFGDYVAGWTAAMASAPAPAPAPQLPDELEEVIAWADKLGAIGHPDRAAAAIRGLASQRLRAPDGGAQSIAAVVTEWVDGSIKMGTDWRSGLADVCAFLDGSAPLDGVWFGDPHPTKRGAFWWRENLRAALAAQPQASHAEFALRALVAAGHITQAKADEALQIAGRAAPAPAEGDALPEPFAYYVDQDYGNGREREYNGLPGMSCGRTGSPLYTADQMRAYAASQSQPKGTAVLTATELAEMWRRACADWNDQVGAHPDPWEHFATRFAAALAAQPQAIDVERLIRECLPGGHSCDPQAIADTIREWARDGRTGVRSMTQSNPPVQPLGAKEQL